MKIACASCGGTVELPDKVGFRDTCPTCDAYLHSCVHCQFWTDSRCTEPAAEKVGDPQGINFCEWYNSRAEPFDGAQGPEPAEGGEGRRAQEGKEAGGKEAAEEMWKKLTKK